MTTRDDEQDVSLATISDGAALEKVAQALRECWDNIADPNTPARAKRKVTLTLTLSPDEERQVVQVQIDCEARLAAPGPASTMIELARTRTGVVATELRPRCRQLDLPEIDNVTPIERGQK